MTNDETRMSNAWVRRESCIVFICRALALAPADRLLWYYPEMDEQSKQLGAMSVIGDWMGSVYDVAVRRHDYHLFLDHDGRYERTIRREEGYERKDTGHWFHDKAEGELRLESNLPDDTDRISSSWWILSVRTCESSNCLLVLRWAALASRNLPVLFYRVHRDGRGYGTGWEQHITKQSSPT